jgi:tRNA(Ile)-lysidine synthase
MMIDVTRSFIKRHSLIKKNDKVLIALSGGMDSMVLIDILLKLKDELGFSIHAAHYDHNIRKTSGSDAEFVRDYCSRHSVPITVGSGDVPKYASEHKVSLEVAARRMRHAFLQKVTSEVNASSIALAHHKNDRAETYLMRVFRGTSGDGLGCMPERDGKLVRPLLSSTRDDIMHYAKVNSLTWREDETNSDPSYTRNNIRHNTIPHIEKEYNSSIINTLSKNAELMKQDRDYFYEIVEKEIKKAATTQDGFYLSDDDFIYLHKAILSRCIRKLLLILGFESDIYGNNIEDIMDLFYEQKTGAMINLPNGAIARRDAFGVELIREENAPDIFYETPLNLDGVTQVVGCGTFTCQSSEVSLKNIKTHSKNIAFLDDMALPKDVVIRPRKTGDIFHPLGAPGKKTLKEYFIDKKISRFKRDYIPLVASGDEILWIVGHEISDKVKMTKDSIMCKKIIFNELKG